MVSVGNSLLWNRIHTGNIPDHRKLPFQDQDEEKPARHSIGMRFSQFIFTGTVRKDTTQAGHNYEIDDVVVTGTRNETDIRHLPMTISVVNRETIGQRSEPSLLPHIDRTGSRIVHHQSWGNGIWSVKRCGRRYQPARYRWQPHYRIIGID